MGNSYLEKHGLGKARQEKVERASREIFETHAFVPKAAIPHQAMWEDFLANIDSYLKISTLMGNVSSLKQTRANLIHFPLGKNDLLSAQKAAYEEYRQARVARMAAELRNTKGAPFLRHVPALRLPDLVLWEELEAAVELLDLGETISAREKAKELERIEAEIAKLIEEASRAHGGIHFVDQRGAKLPHYRVFDEIVGFWAMIQGECCLPVNPRAVAIGECPEAEQEAYEKLGMSSEINPDGVRPYPVE